MTAGSEAHYRCDDGFTLEGEMTAVCRVDQRWSSTPICRRTTGKVIEQISKVIVIVFTVKQGKLYPITKFANLLCDLLRCI